MVTNALCRSFQQLGLSVQRGLAARYCSSQASKVGARNGATLLYRPRFDGERSMYEPNLWLTTTRWPILDLPRGPPSIGRIREFPINENSIIGEPAKIHHDQEDSGNEKSLDLPSNGQMIEKRAQRMIVIRRRKMRRHKLRKLRKRMKFLWAKIRQKREMKKEKAFHAELLGQIREAEAFDAKAYVASRFAELDNVRLPSKYRGVHLPEAQIREFLERDREKLEKKLNKPRLKL